MAVYWKWKSIVPVLVVAMAVYAMSIEVNYDFEKTKIGTLPQGWIADATHPSQKFGKWEVIAEKDAPSGQKVLRLSDVGDNRGSTFNLCYTKEIPFLNGEIDVKFKANSGRIDEGGGIMWRVQDHDNYYVARFNPLEDNFRFYSVKKGVRRQIASADVKLSKGWHEMRIVQKGSRFSGYLDGKKLLDTENESSKKSGGVGVWTKADAATSFDDFHVRVNIK